MNQDDIVRIAREACPYTTDEMRGAFYEGFLKGAVAEREWQGLTDDEIDTWNIVGHESLREFVRDIEAKLKERNT